MEEKDQFDIDEILQEDALIKKAKECDIYRMACMLADYITEVGLTDEDLNEIIDTAKALGRVRKAKGDILREHYEEEKAKPMPDHIKRILFIFRAQYKGITCDSLTD